MQSIKTLAGTDVSALTLAVARWRDGAIAEREFSNDAAGHRELIAWLGKLARVCLEATGVYHLQLALALFHAGIEVMVINPLVAKDFAASLVRRSKTDRVDALSLLEYVRRMEYRSWEPPSDAVLELRELSRRLTELIHQSVDEKNRLHAKTTAAISTAVIRDVQQHLKQLSTRIKSLESAAYDVVKSDEALKAMYGLIITGRGIGRRSAILLLGELAVLDRTMTTRQIVAHAGLDPRVYESGTSVQKATRISRRGNARIRAILYMNALTAIRHDKGARTFYARLIARGKKPKQALVAVMRKLLHGLWIALQRGVAFDNDVLFAASLAQAESSDSAVAAPQPELGQDHPQGRSEAKERPRPLDRGRAQATRSRERRSETA
jgi:transposase